MSLFSKLFKLFLAVVLMPFVPMVLLLAYYQEHLKDNILETHANLAQIVSSSMNQHIEDLGWRLSFAPHVTDALNNKKSPVPILRDALAANPDFVMLAVLSPQGKERYRAGDKQILRDVPPLDLSGDPVLDELSKKNELSVSSFDVVDGRPISEFIYPLPNGDFLYGIMSFFAFLSRVQEQRIGTTGRIYLVDQNGSVYAGEYQYRPEFDAEELRRAFTSGDRLIKALKTKQDDYVGAYASTPILGAYVAVLQLKSEAYRSIYYTNIILALFLLTIATLAYFGALTFAERLGEPIGALSEAAKEVSKGNLEGKIDEDIGWGEFKQLISQFNKMTADLKDYQVLQLQAQISEMKEHVFRAVAHDLRAPLLGLQGYLYILQSGKASKAEEKEYLDQMSRAARDLSSLLEDVLDVSRVQAGMLSPRKEPVDAAALAKSVTDALAPTAAEKGLLLETDVPPLTLEADAKLLRRVLMNLVSNAVKFTDKGYVRVCGGQDAAGDWLAVEDSGIGMSEQEMKGLFQKYYQINSDKAGYGLGLFISRQIVTAHGGELQVTSRRGKGSRFTVTFPKEKK